MAFFDSIADEYDAWYESPLGAFADKVETKLAFSLLEPKNGMRILDAGCGTGNFSLKLHNMGCDVTGIDMSQKMLAAAKRKAGENGAKIDFSNMDIYDLKFNDEAFDGVFCMAAFEFIEYPEKALNELLRVTKKGSRVLIGTINRESPWGRLYRSPEFKQNSIFKYANFKTLADLKSIRSESVEAAGECLYMPPDAKPEEINMENELRFSQFGEGGFVCALWKK